MSRRRLLPFFIGCVLSGASSHASDTPPGVPIGFAQVAPLEKTNELRPAIVFRPVDPAFQLVSFRLDGVDVTALVSIVGGIHRYDPVADLAGGEHVATVEHVATGVRTLSSWRFTTPVPPPRPEVSAGWSVQGEVSRLRTEPVDGERPVTNQTISTLAPHLEGTLSDSRSETSAGYNATWAQSYDRQNPPERVSAPAILITGKRARFKATLGNAATETFAPSLLLQTVSTRRGLELGVDGGFGDVRLYGNIDDGLPSAAGVNEFRQNLYGFGFSPNLGTQRLKLRALYQYAADVRDPLFHKPPTVAPPFGNDAAPNDAAPAQAAFFGSAPKKGQLISLSMEWTAIPSVNLVLKGETVRSAFTNDSSTQGVTADYAYAFSVSANPALFGLMAGARLVNDSFGAPANPSLIAGRRIFDLNVTRPFGSLFIAATYARTLDSGGSGARGATFAPPVGHGDAASLTASYSLPRSMTSLSVSLQRNETFSQGADARQTNLSLSLGQPIGRLQVSLGLLGGRQTAAGPVPNTSDLRGATLSLSAQGAVFSLQSSLGANRNENRTTGETMTSLNAFAMPDVSLFRRMLSITPIGTWARQVTTTGLADSDSWSYGGRLTLRTWGSLRGFALYGQYLESVTAPKAEGAMRAKDRRLGAGLVILLGGGALGPTLTTQLPTPQTPLR